MTYKSEQANRDTHKTIFTSQHTVRPQIKEMNIPMTNTHCHPFNPLLPSRVLCIAVIMMPANILPTCPTAVKIAVRLAISDGLLVSH
jgi:hypothetical protein